MIFSKILFFFLIIVCGMFYILYLWDFAFVLFIIMLVLPVVMFIELFITKRMMTVDFSFPESVTVKNEDFPVQLCLENRSIFPVGKAEAHIEYYNIFNNQINTFELQFPIQAKNSQKVTFKLNSKYCGVIKIKSAYISIFDPLKIFRMKVGRNIISQITVMPEGYDVSGDVFPVTRVNEESLIFSENRPGDDPSEVFDLRDYIPGDKLNRIHWKLSSKNQDFIVKEYSLPVDVPCLLFLDLRCYEDSDYTLPVYDTLIETLVSLSRLLIANERLHTIVYFSAKQREFVAKDIDGIESLSGAIQEMLLSLMDNLYCESPDDYLKEHSGISLSSFTFITSQENDDTLRMIDEQVDADIKNAFIVCRSSTDAESEPTQHGSVNVEKVLIGKIISSIKEIEL